MINKSEKVPLQMQARFDAITSITDVFCNENLNEEYRQLARYVTAALCRKRPSPLTTGKVNSWACGIIYALGFVNFLFDKSHAPYMSAAELCERFGLSKSSGSNYSKKVRDILNMHQLDPNWCLPSRMDSNPLAWFISVNGMMVDARRLPRELQEIALEKGLIPYIPEDK